MEDFRDMAAISLPFTAGVAAGAALANGTLAPGASAAAGGALAVSASPAVGEALAVSASSVAGEALQAGASLPGSDALAGIVTAGCFPGAVPISAVAGASLIAVAGLVYLLFRRRTGPLPYCLMYFLAGLFCCLTAWALPRPEPGPLGRTAAQALAGLRRLISSTPFAHSSTGSLVSALLTGDRSGLTPEQTAAFRGSGASHILALSGLHLGVIYLIVNRLLSIIGNTPFLRRLRSAVVVLFSGFYTIATGAGPSIVRAFLFILIRETCSLFPERHTSPIRVLMAALTLQLAFRPRVITTLGFQLSYLAMTGITILYPYLSSWYPSTSPNRRMTSGNATPIWQKILDTPLRRIWQAAALAISCQVFTAPLVWIRFHTFPKYFLITNLLALPVTSSLMATAVAAIALQGLGGCPPLLADLTDLLAQALLFSLDILSRL